MAERLGFPRTQALEVIEYYENASRQAPRKKARPFAELLQRRPGVLAVQPEKARQGNGVRGVVECADGHSRGWSAPKSEDFGG